MKVSKEHQGDMPNDFFTAMKRGRMSLARRRTTSGKKAKSSQGCCFDFI